jgi:outer membrane receptor protein involved in Fe transport
VNGRVLNHRGEQGALSERDLPMLRDIDYVEVVRGPGAATYGPGAIAGVINIVTLNGRTFEGIDTEYRQGTGFQYSSVDVRYGKKLSDDSGVFLYYGYADVQGATQGDSPAVLGRTFTARSGVPVVAGEPLTFALPNDGDAFRSEGKHKLHAQYNNGEFDAWFRWTRGGSHQTPHRNSIVLSGADPIEDVVGVEQGYQQFTLYAGHRYEVSPCLTFDTAISWDSLDLVRLPLNLAVFPTATRRYREDELQARIIGTWTPNEIHAIAFGFEYSWERFGLPSHLSPGPPATSRQQPLATPWSTSTYSMLGEYQVQLSDTLTGYLSGRMDQHSYTEWLYSPRVALVHTPNEYVTNKLIASESTRRPEDDDLRAAILAGNDSSRPETIQVLELRHERQTTEQLWWAVSAFWNDWDILSFTNTSGTVESLARLQIYGLELEANYKSENTRWYFSHGFSKLARMTLSDPPRQTNISVAPFGYGNELNNWSNHITKLAVSHDINPCWSVDSSMRIYWGFPGAEDASFYNSQVLGTPLGQLGWIDPGYKKAFRGNYYLNFGLENHTSEHLVIRADFYNVLGWIKPEYNKRNELARMSDYRVEAPAVGVSVRYTY